MPTTARVTKIVRASGVHFVADLDNGMMRVGIHNKQSLDLPAFKVPFWLNDAEFEAFVLDMFDQSPDAIIRRRVFIGVFPGALVFADREREEHGDYKRLASLPYHTLELEWGKDVPPDIREWITRAAAHYQAKRGDAFQISQCGQTVRLGVELPESNEEMKQMPPENATQTPKLHQQLYGIKAVEIDHASGIAFAWHGGGEVVAISCSNGRIAKRYSLQTLGVEWSLDESSLKARVKEALHVLAASASSTALGGSPRIS